MRVLPDRPEFTHEELGLEETFVQVSAEFCRYCERSIEYEEPM